jgi:glycosyltransferase involved in cell wall biosynthesis
MNSRPPTMQILSILDARVITGPARGLIQLARHLPPGARLHIALLARDENTPLPPIAEEAGDAPLTVHRLVETSAYDPRVIARATQLARDIGASIIQSHSYKPHLIAMAVSRMTGTPWIGFHHGWTAENLKVRLFHALDRATLPQADRVVAVSREGEQWMLAAGCAREQVTMISNAVDPADFSCRDSRAEVRRDLSIDEDAVLLCAVGRLSREKGQDVLIDAFARIAPRHPALQVALAGDGPDRLSLEARSTALGVRARVHFLGHQPHVARVYTAADIIVLPSRSEGMPNALLEAMATGTPVIAAAVGGVPEVAHDGHDAWLVPSDDPPALAASIEDAIEHPEEMRRRALRAQQQVLDSRAPGQRAARLVALYDDVLGFRTTFHTSPQPHHRSENIAP